MEDPPADNQAQWPFMDGARNPQRRRHRLRRRRERNRHPALDNVSFFDQFTFGLCQDDSVANVFDPQRDSQNFQNFPLQIDECQLKYANQLLPYTMFEQNTISQNKGVHCIYKFDLYRTNKLRDNFSGEKSINKSM